MITGATMNKSSLIKGLLSLSLLAGFEGGREEANVEVEVSGQGVEFGGRGKRGMKEKEAKGKG